MKKKHQTATPVTTIGISSLLVIFIILCLVTFACLSLSTAKSDYSFSQQNADHKTAYYDACNKVESELNRVSNGESSETHFEVKISDIQQLEVDIELTGTSEKNGRNYDIKRWQVVSIAERNYDGTMNLIR